MAEDQSAGRPIVDRVTLLETFLERSTSDQKEIFSKTGRMLKEAKVAQDYHVTVMNELTGKMGLKSSKFPSVFDGPSLWSTIETLGQYALSTNKGIPNQISEAILTQQNQEVKTIVSDLRKNFVVEEDWNEFLINLGSHMKNEAEDKVFYHKAMGAYTKRLDDFEKLARSGSGTTSRSSTRSIYNPFQRSPPKPLGRTGVAVNDLNDLLDSLEGTIGFWKELIRIV